MTAPLFDFAAQQDNRERYHGQLDILDPEVLAKPKYLFVGAGAIGSFACTMLAKMGAKDITVVDFDTIEEHNISNQCYPVDEIGTPKVDALQAMVHELSGETIKPHNVAWDEAFLSAGHKFDVVVSCVDNMEVRKRLWEYYRDKCSHFIDGRMGAEFIKAYAVNTEKASERDFYAGTLHSTAEAVQARCTEKTIMYTVLVVSGILLGLIKRSLLAQKRPVETTYDCVNNLSSRVHRD